jgi:hypothetical protein
MAARSTTTVVGKICPCCGQAGWVLLETERRIVYECPNKHEYETRKAIQENPERSRPLSAKSLTSGQRLG